MYCLFSYKSFNDFSAVMTSLNDIYFLVGSFKYETECIENTLSPKWKDASFKVNYVYMYIYEI